MKYTSYTCRVGIDYIIDDQCIIDIGTREKYVTWKTHFPKHTKYAE